MKDKPDTKNLEYRLWRMIEGDLDRGQSDQLRARVRTDDDLASIVGADQALSKHLDALAEAQDDVIEPSDWDGQRAEIMSRLERRALLNGPRKRRFFPHPWRVAAAAAAAVLLTAGLSLWLIPETPTQTSVAQVRMLPADAAPAERAVVSVSARRGMDYEDFALAPGLQSTGPGPESSPPGTVALSFGDGPPAVVGKASAVPMGL